MTTHTLDLRQSLNLRLSQKMQAAISLLQMSNQDLCQYVDAIVTANPLLEYEENFAEPVDNFQESIDDGKEHGELYSDNYSNLWPDESNETVEHDLRYNNTFQYHDEDFDPFYATAAVDTFYDSIKRQIEAIFSGLDQKIALELQGYLDEKGYLKNDYVEVQEKWGLTDQRFNGIIEKLQTLEPTGIFARTLSECLRLQLLEKKGQSKDIDGLLMALNDNPFMSLDAYIDYYQKKGGEPQKLIAILRDLNPKPAYAFEEVTKNHVVPDLLMKRLYNDWVIELNPVTLPRILLHSSYYNDLKKHIKKADDKNFLQEKYSEAKWLLKSLHTRAVNTLKVAEVIVRKQNDFFISLGGPLKPLSLRDVAEETGLSESTVSRVTTDKYILTPGGLFELKYFFSVVVNKDHADVSAKGVQQTLKVIITNENRQKPYSDNDLMKMLSQEGYTVARRTIAKYRMILGIDTASARKQLNRWQ